MKRSYSALFLLSLLSFAKAEAIQIQDLDTNALSPVCASSQSTIVSYSLARQAVQTVQDVASNYSNLEDCISTAGQFVFNSWFDIHGSSLITLGAESAFLYVATYGGVAFNAIGLKPYYDTVMGLYKTSAFFSTKLAARTFAEHVVKIPFVMSVARSGGEIAVQKSLSTVSNIFRSFLPQSPKFDPADKFVESVSIEAFDAVSEKTVLSMLASSEEATDKIQQSSSDDLAAGTIQSKAAAVQAFLMPVVKVLFNAFIDLHGGSLLRMGAEQAYPYLYQYGSAVAGSFKMESCFNVLVQGYNYSAFNIKSLAARSFGEHVSRIPSVTSSFRTLSSKVLEKTVSASVQGCSKLVQGCAKLASVSKSWIFGNSSEKVIFANDDSAQAVDSKYFVPKPKLLVFAPQITLSSAI